MAESTPAPPTDSDPNPRETLKRRIRQICTRVILGKAAIHRWEVKLQQTVRVVSIVLTSLGSAGVIVDKVSNKLPDETSWAFVGSVVVLLFGIVLQILNELKIEQTASDARMLHEACAVFETQLGMVLEESDPRAVVERLRQEVYAVILKYHRAAPAATTELEQRADELAAKLIEANEGGWRLPRAKRPARSHNLDDPAGKSKPRAEKGE
jgi:hypothetical protein